MRSWPAFTPEFLASLTVPELVGLQHELRQYPEDKAFLEAVLAEIARRDRWRIRSDPQ